MSIEKIRTAFEKANIGMKMACTMEKIELELDDLRMTIGMQWGGNATVDVKRKCIFSRFFLTENSFIWHIQNDDKNIDSLVERIKKIQTTIENGPYGFSKRSTYIKRQNKVARAKSGNFVHGARVLKMVSIGEKGEIGDELAIPDNEPWFLIELETNAAEMEIVYNMENWWLVGEYHGETVFGGVYGRPKERTPAITSVLERTKGKLLTVHDKFVIDLAVRLFAEDRNQ